jgi:cytochrome c553
MDGNSNSPRYPKLAGQTKAYLVAQMKAFRDGSRADTDGHFSMWEVAKLLDDEMALKAANFFSAQRTTASIPGDAHPVASGRDEHERSSKSRERSACVACHARNELDDKMALKAADYFSTQRAQDSTPGDANLVAKGKEIYVRGVLDKQVPACAICHAREGRGYAVVPRLAGQHPQYLAAQLKASHVRADGRRKLAVTIETKVDKLSDEEVRQVTAYLQGL